MMRCLKEQAADISTRLKHRRLGAHTVQVKVRYSDFTTLTRQISVEEPITEAADIYRLGCFLLGREKLVSRPLRLLVWASAICASRMNNNWRCFEPGVS
jgi:DNA polymerase IV